MLRQELCRSRGAEALGRRFGRAVFAGEDQIAVMRDAHHVHPQVTRQLAAYRDATQAVALGVEQRGKSGDRKTAGQHGHDAATDAAFGRQADFVEPTAGIVVHAAGAHHAERRFHLIQAHHALPGQRIDAAVGQCRAHDAQVTAGDQQ